MARDPKHDILFTPIQVGPKTLKNRLQQAAHCNGSGSEKPGFQADFRAMKAEGGFAVVGTEYCSIAPDSDDVPRISARLWDKGDVRNLAHMVDKAHEHGALASVELWYGGAFAAGMESRAHGARRAPSHSGAYFGYLTAARAMTKKDIREVQGYYVRAAKLAREAGFDIVTCMTGVANDATHQFLLPAFNQRTDEYGGSLRNRARFALETFEMIREAIGPNIAFTNRYCADTLPDPHGMGKHGCTIDGDAGDFMEMADHLIDLWDLTIGWVEWGEQAGPSRTHRQNWMEEIVRKAKQRTKKPTANVGRLTSPDVMAEMIRSGQCDVISLVRPGIADPFLPKKIEEGRLEDIRECIGCNMCISRFEIGGAPLVCTQNATAAEEFRRGWHPEKFTKAKNHANDVLVIGAGPAGMECARILGERGMRRVHLVEAEKEIGGHVKHVAALPTLGEWGRIINYRQIQLNKLKNVEVITGKRLSKQDVLDYGAEIVVVATGSRWSPIGQAGVTMNLPIAGVDARTQSHVLTPEQLFAGKPVGRSVVVYDLDGYFMGISIAEQLATQGHDVTLVTYFPSAGPYTYYTLEQPRTVRKLRKLGVKILYHKTVARIAPGAVTITDIWDDSEQVLAADSTVLVTQRFPEEDLYLSLTDDPKTLAQADITAVYRVGDCALPGYIADAVFEGHRLAREIDSADPETPLPFIRERRIINATELDYTLDSPTIRS
ncbi:MAG: FAD-dependent oxidoreductase [Dehalococcoidia bacterium]